MPTRNTCSSHAHRENLTLCSKSRAIIVLLLSLLLLLFGLSLFDRSYENGTLRSSEQGRDLHNRESLRRVAETSIGRVYLGTDFV